MQNGPDVPVVLITGAGSGIGAATARSFAADGAAVAVTDVNLESADRVTADIVGAGGRAVAVELDVSVEAAWRAAMESVHSRLGRVTVLHSNAAANSGQVMNRDLDVISMDVAVWDLMMAVVLRGSMLSCKHVIPDMIDVGGGSVVLTSSIKGLVGSSVRTAYSTAKGALEQFTRSVATGYGRFGIRCNAVAPGIIETPGLREVVGENYYEELRAAHLLPRTGTVDDVVSLVRYLASPAGSYITGQTIVVDGGMSVFVPVLSPQVAKSFATDRASGEFTTQAPTD